MFRERSRMSTIRHVIPVRQRRDRLDLSFASQRVSVLQLCVAARVGGLAAS